MSAAAAQRGPPLSESVWQSFLDDSGRLVAESELRKAIFQGGIEHAVRRAVWPYLLGVYPFQSTTRERQVLLREHRIEYAALKGRWKEVLNQASGGSDWELPPGEDDQYMFIFIQAKVNAMRHTIDEEQATKAIKAIKKDVPRTDRNIAYFQGDDNEQLKWLEDILVTYAVFHPTVGYVQGMNDILSLILFVMNDEADAYCCFEKYIDLIQDDFQSAGMLGKLELLQELLQFLDPELHQHFVAIDAGDLVFCHRWLLLSFKREFEFHDALRIFEILGSHHLEVTSMAAEKARSVERRVQKALALGHEQPSPQRSKGAAAAATTATTPAEAGDEKFTFELFVCVALLTQFRAEMMAAKDFADLFTLINGLVSTVDLDVLLRNAEAVFFEFCRKKCVAAPGTTELAAEK